MKSYNKLESNPSVLGGKPCIKGTRVSVDIILEWIASGASIKDIVKKYPHLPEAGISQAILYAANLFKNEIILEVNAS